MERLLLRQLHPSVLSKAKNWLTPVIWKNAVYSVPLLGQIRVSQYATKVDQTQVLRDMRNIGIAAHIDSGKTTLTERLLFYTGRISEMHEVKGKDKVGATMDSMDLERERGITIQSAATYVNWKGHEVNIIDTPGHVDFTVEVERSLRVLDGTVLVICANGGVQSQTLTVNRQINRYKVPSMIFINKLDRLASNPLRCLTQIREKLHRHAAFLQIPDGLENECQGIIDLLEMKGIYFEGPQGQTVVEKPIPSHLAEKAEEKRQELIECVSDVDEILGDLILMDEIPTVQDLKAAIRRTTIARTFTPVLMGSALKNKGVQPLLDAVTEYLPNPTEVQNFAFDANTATDDNPSGKKVQMDPARTNEKDMVALAFKLEQSKYGQLTYLRVYQGAIIKGDTIFNVRTKQRAKASRLVRMHSNKLEDLPEAYAGDICALFGVECASGDTFVGRPRAKYSMESIYVPDAVVSMSLKCTNRDQTDKMSKALNRFAREDPTYRMHWDDESKEMIVSGMGELQLEVYAQRMNKEYGLDVVLGRPKVAYRETIVGRVEFDHIHKRQSGGAGQYGRLIGYMEALPDEQNTRLEFVDKTTGTNVPRQYMKSIKKGFLEDSFSEGLLIGAPMAGLRVVVEDGAHHIVDSSEIAFRICAQFAAKKALEAAEKQILQPIMLVEITAPVEFVPIVMGSINRKKAIVQEQNMDAGEYFVVVCHVPLSKMFGYASELRSQTEGKGEYSMEFAFYEACPEDLQEEMAEKYQEELNPDQGKTKTKKGGRR